MSLVHRPHASHLFVPLSTSIIPHLGNPSHRIGRGVTAMSNAQRPLHGRTALVTGASRGIGRGLAVGLGELGATVCITGRKHREGQNDLEETAVLVRAAGGECETFFIDHGCDEDVEGLFRELRLRYDRDSTKLDVLVNNAYSAVDFIIKSSGIPTWRKSVAQPGTPSDSSRPGDAWDLINNVGLRGNFVCAVYAMRQFATQGSGVIVNISSFGGLVSIFDGVYGVGKSGVDRLTAELARESPPGVTCFTFYPGIVATEAMAKAFVSSESTVKGLSSWNTESPLFLGRTLGKALADGKMTRALHGRIAIAAEMAKRFGVKDEHGNTPLSLRSLRFILLDAFPFLIKSPARFVVPDVRVPLLVLMAYGGIIRIW